MVRLTRFDGRPIEKLVISSGFRVEVMKSNNTSAAVEIPAELEPYLIFEMNSNTLEIGFEQLPKGVKWPKGAIVSAKIGMKTLNSVNIKGGVSMTIDGEFETSDKVDIAVISSSMLKGLAISTSDPAEIRCSSSGIVEGSVTSPNITASIIGSSTGKLILNSNGRVALKCVSSSILKDLDVTSANNVTVDCSSSSIVGGRISAPDLAVNVIGSSIVRLAQNGGTKLGLKCVSSSTFDGSSDAAAASCEISSSSTVALSHTGRESMIISAIGSSTFKGATAAAALNCKVVSSSSIDIKQNDGRSFMGSVSSGSNMNISGSVGTASLVCIGSSSFNGAGYVAQDANVEATSSALVSITVEKMLNANVASASKILYGGNPSVNLHTTTASSVRKL